MSVKFYTPEGRVMGSDEDYTEAQAIALDAYADLNEFEDYLIEQGTQSSFAAECNRIIDAGIYVWLSAAGQYIEESELLEAMEQYKVICAERAKEDNNAVC